MLNDIHVGDAATVMARLLPNSVDLIVTSPPYWNAVTYDGINPWDDYNSYLDAMLAVWQQCARVLRPNGKLCVNTAPMPIPKQVIQQHTRHLKNIPFDLDHSILQTELLRYSVFIWQKQTSKLMFGSYPYPGNILECNTVEFINVYVKPGKPPQYDATVKQANRLSRDEWLDLTQQVWFMYPADIKRQHGHPAPFPEKLPARLMRLYTYGATAGFPGEIVLDPFVGTGTTCAVAKAMGRQWIGIDCTARYVEYARQRMDMVTIPPALLVGHATYPSADELRSMVANTVGDAAKAKHKRTTYGRALHEPDWLSWSACKV